MYWLLDTRIPSRGTGSSMKKNKHQPEEKAATEQKTSHTAASWTTNIQLLKATYNQKK